MSRVLTSQDEVNKMRQLHSKGYSVRKISEEMGLPEHRIGYWIYDGKSKKKNQRSYKEKWQAKKQKNIIIDQPAAKPMIAIVGTPNEVTATLKELFS